MTSFVAGFGSRNLPFGLSGSRINPKVRHLQSNASRQADYYQVLELESKSASDADIKAAYRRLARKWHPDISTAPNATTIFKNLTRAFETLIDEERRAEYDQILASARGEENTSQKSSSDLYSILKLSLSEAMVGGRHRVEVRALSQCSRCKGSGGAPGGRSERCQVCKGRGDIFKTKNNNATGETSTALTGCPACGGRGLLIIDCCPKCSGNGLSRATREIEIRVPAGIDNGTKLRIPEQGDVGECGDRQGDLIIEVFVLPHEKVQRIGLNLHSEIKIPLFMAILGGNLQVETLLNGPMQLIVPPGTAHGTQLSLAKQGVLGKGAHYYTVRIEVPRELDEREIEVIRKLADVSTTSTTEK